MDKIQTDTTPGQVYVINLHKFAPGEFANAQNQIAIFVPSEDNKILDLYDKRAIFTEIANIMNNSVKLKDYNPKDVHSAYYLLMDLRSDNELVCEYKPNSFESHVCICNNFIIKKVGIYKRYIDDLTQFPIFCLHLTHLNSTNSYRQQILLDNLRHKYKGIDPDVINTEDVIDESGAFCIPKQKVADYELRFVIDSTSKYGEKYDGINIGSTDEYTPTHQIVESTIYGNVLRLFCDMAEQFEWFEISQAIKKHSLLGQSFCDTMKRVWKCNIDLEDVPDSWYLNDFYNNIAKYIRNGYTGNSHDYEMAKVAYINRHHRKHFRKNKKKLEAQTNANES